MWCPVRDCPLLHTRNPNKPSRPCPPLGRGPHLWQRICSAGVGRGSPITHPRHVSALAHAGAVRYTWTSAGHWRISTRCRVPANRRQAASVVQLPSRSTLSSHSYGAPCRDVLGQGGGGGFKGDGARTPLLLGSPYGPRQRQAENC